MHKKKLNKWTILLNRYRFMHGYSMESLAQKVNLTTANYFEIEKCNRGRPKYETFLGLSLEMGMTIEELQKIYYESYIPKN